MAIAASDFVIANFVELNEGALLMSQPPAIGIVVDDNGGGGPFEVLFNDGRFATMAAGGPLTDWDGAFAASTGELIGSVVDPVSEPNPGTVRRGRVVGAFRTDPDGTPTDYVLVKTLKDGFFYFATPATLRVVPGVG